MLSEDHKKVQELFKKFEKAKDKEDGEACEAIAKEACGELEVHASLEEELFYPAAREALGEEDDLVEEAEVEHQSAKDLIGQLRSMDPEDPKYAATFVVLAEYVKHHIKEEEGEMFPKLKKAKMEVEALGENMKHRKLQLMEELGLGDGETIEENAMDEEEKMAEAEAPSRSRSRTR
jgi:hypothetical protein